MAHANLKNEATAPMQSGQAMISKNPAHPVSSGGGLQPYYTIPEVADRHRVSPKTVRREIEAKRLKVTRFGRCVRISAADLALYEATCGLQGPT